MSRLIHLFWRWSLFFTLPVTIIFIYWGYCTAIQYGTFGVRYDATPANASLLRYGEIEAMRIMRQISLVLSPSGGFYEYKKEDIRTINLFISEANVSLLNANLPHSGFEYVKGGIWDGDKVKKIKIRYRGDFLTHWGYAKKSIRVKTSKKSLFGGLRKFNLIAPKEVFLFNNYFGYKLAEQLGLIVPYTEVVNVSINGENRGLYILVEQLEELTLRRNGRMPGDLYVGELLAKDAYTGVGDFVFEHPGLWDKAAINNHYPDESRKPLEKLISLLNSPQTAEVQAELVQMLDVDAWGRFSAFETLAQTFHYDGKHNWRLYYDPMRSVFEPIVWDPIAWAFSLGKELHPENIRTKLHKALFLNGDFLRARQRAFEDFFEKNGDETYLKFFDKTIDRAMPIINRDPGLRYPQSKIEKRITRVRTNVGKYFSEARTLFFEPSGKIRYTPVPSGIALSVSGRIPVQRVSVTSLHQINEKISATLQYWLNNEKIEVDVTDDISVRGRNLTFDTSLIPKTGIFIGQTELKNRLSIEDGYYQLVFEGLPTNNTFIDVLVDRGRGYEPAEYTDTLNITSFENVFNVVKASENRPHTVWQGDILVKNTRFISDDVMIMPGTTVRVLPGASLIFDGRIIAKGTLENPIRFIPATEDQAPWGAIVLKGDGANNSQISYCQFIGGSGLKEDLFEYTAMFSVHDVQGVVFENCLFRDSKITDDMVHIVYSEARFSHCSFEKSLMDALDIDISTALVEHCFFTDSGNDSLDLMTSKVVLIDTLIEKAADKAASVGEGSYLLAINNVFRGNAIAVQVKDGSVASIYNTDLLANKQALDAYKKNWRYNDGGKIYLYKSRMVGNDKMITAGKKSRIRVYDSYYDKLSGDTGKRIKFAATVDSIAERKAQNKKLHRDTKEIDYMNQFDSSYWGRIDTTRRGAALNTSQVREGSF